MKRLGAAILTLTLLTTGCNSNPTLTAPTTTASQTTTLDESAAQFREACELVAGGFEEVEAEGERIFEDVPQGPFSTTVWTNADLPNFGQVGPDSATRAWHEWQEEKRSQLEELVNMADAVVLAAARMVEDDNPDGDALLSYAITSKAIVNRFLEIRDPSMLTLDDADEFKAFEAVRARCRVTSN
jgi:hypothetical protein